MSDTARTARPRRPRKNIVMFVLSLLLGTIGVFYSKHHIEGQVAYYRGQFERTEEMVKVVVPNRAIQRGETLSADMLSIRDIPSKYADSNSVDRASHELALGQRIDFDIDEGRPLLWAHLAGGRTPTFSGKVPDGLRAMTVRVDEVNSISGFLQPHDKVDLMFSHGTGDEQQVVPLIERLDVIATGIQTVVDKAGNTTRRDFSTITVQVTPEQAQRITLARQVGTLTAMLRNPEDETPLGPMSVTVAELLGQEVPPVVVAKAVAPPVPRPRAAPAAPPPVPEPPAIEYIIGGRR